MDRFIILATPRIMNLSMRLCNKKILISNVIMSLFRLYYCISIIYPVNITITLAFCNITNRIFSDIIEPFSYNYPLGVYIIYHIKKQSVSP